MRRIRVLIGICRLRIIGILVSLLIISMVLIWLGMGKSKLVHHFHNSNECKSNEQKPFPPSIAQFLNAPTKNVQTISKSSPTQNISTNHLKNLNPKESSKLPTHNKLSLPKTPETLPSTTQKFLFMTFQILQVNLINLEIWNFLVSRLNLLRLGLLWKGILIVRNRIICLKRGWS